jgi:ABC-2 type transport system ATP-binding protein
VTFSIAAGEVFALLGPNGAGKTTTVEILEGYRRADAGSVRVLGTDPAAAGPSHRARVGLMLQGGGGIDPRATPAEVLRLYARLHAPPRDPDELLELVGLTGAARTRFRRLSGGERQRLGLALALVGRPEVLLLDEPTAGMDPAARAATRDLVRALRDYGITILLTTHDLADVERLADRVAILDKGRLVALDTPGALTAGANTVLRFGLPYSVPLHALQADLAVRWPGAHLVPENSADGVGRTTVRVDGVPPDPALVAAIGHWAAGAGVLLEEIRTSGATLEERYLELTGDRAVERAP